MEVADGARQHAWEEMLIAYSKGTRKATGPMLSGVAIAFKHMHGSLEWGDQPQQPAAAAPSEQHQHIHLQMTPREASDAYQQMLREE
jgi:hypothetical protein